MAPIDLVFAARGGKVPIDHGYALFSALAHRLPGLHERKDVGLFNLRGTQSKGTSLLVGHGSLRIRCPMEAVELFLPLAGAAIPIVDGEVTLGAAPRVFKLDPSESLSSRLVTFKHAVDDQSFRASVQKFLAELGCAATIQLGRRRVVSIAGKRVIGYALTLTNLSPQSSLRLQEHGLGGRRHMGCGLFLATRPHGPPA